ncbi:MAG: alkaline phosphatase D family protein [Minicystis sp.]
MSDRSPLDRRTFLRSALAASGSLAIGCAPEATPPAPPPVATIPALGPPPPTAAPAIVPSDRLRPILTHGVQSGDPTSRSAIVWARANRLARMIVEWDVDPHFPNPRRAEGPIATADSDFTARLDLGDLPPGRRVHYRVVFENPDAPRAKSEPTAGSFMTAPEDRGDVTFAWSGDTAGQGWGINVEWGGMKTYEAVRRAQPDFFIHCGDLIYADAPIPAEIKLHDGSIWRNVTTEAKSKVAETLADFRGNHAYNLMDENVRRLYAEVASLVMWDDHEIHNNWFPGETLEDKRYTERSCRVLAVRSRQAMTEYTPIRPVAGNPARVYRSFRRGPLLDVFLLDERTYRGDNGENRERTKTPMLGAAQLAWIQEQLATSTATWKVIASDQPLCLTVAEGKHNIILHDAFANNKGGAPLGRELELAELLRFIKRRRIKNVVFVTADVHYAAAHRYDPRRAGFADFDPFWEFVAGPLHASTYGPNPLDPTFGPEVVYKSPPSGRLLRSPADGGQYFGTVRIDGKSAVLTVTLWDLNGTKLYAVDLPPAR